MTPPTRRSGPEGKGRLVVVATPIGNLADLSPRATEALTDADVICCEDTRHTGRLLEHAKVRGHRLVSLHAHNENERISTVLKELEAGKKVALVSDAGTPLVSDPGSRLVGAALEAGFDVTTVPGPSAALSALVLSGLDASRFRFDGFLPRAGKERRARIAAIASSDVPAVIFESPKRLVVTLRDLAAAAGGERRIVIARELTKLHEEVWRGRADEALERSMAREPIGEHVIVVDAAPVTSVPEREAFAAIESLFDAGLRLKDATRAVEVLLGVPHRVAYSAALELRALSDEQGRLKEAPARGPSGGRPVR